MNELHQTLNSIGTGLTILAIIWLSAVKITRLEVKVETMWGMLLKRAIVDGVGQKLMEVHSPVRLINDSGKLLEDMAPELRTFYTEKCKGLDERAAAMEIEKAFGERLIKEVCLPNNISNLVCIVIALAVAKGEPLTEILDRELPEKEKP